MLMVFLGQCPLFAAGLRAQLRANALEHLASLVEGLDASQVLQKLLLLHLRHALHWLLWRRVDARCGRIGQDALR